MANRVGRRVRAGAKKRARKARRAAVPSAERQLDAACDLLFDMEEPLNQATWLVRVPEQTGDRDPETDAIAFVATEARLRLDAVHEIWKNLLVSATAG